MITYFDLIQDSDFRDYVYNRFSKGSGIDYIIPTSFPILYRYRPLSNYAIDDIIKNTLSLSAIGEFNDIFDGAMHLYGLKSEQEAAAEAQWSEMESLRIASHFPEGILRREDVVNSYVEYCKVESRLKFRELDYLGTYVCCFSTDNASTLMWSHYADSNKGLCIEYDFNQLPSNDLLRNSVFPVVYTEKPIDTSDLLTDTGNRVYQYPLDAAVLCTALNKASVWRYENEWRIVWVMASFVLRKRRIPIGSFVHPSKVYLGYHFLKSFFFYSHNKEECDKCTDALSLFIQLLDYLKKMSIPVAVMKPMVGTYSFNPCDISIDGLEEFIRKQFPANRPGDMRFYYVVHDHLMDLIEKQ